MTTTNSSAPVFALYLSSSAKTSRFAAVFSSHPQGRRAGYRVLIAYRAGERAIFLYGFAKSERDNINARQLADWQARAQDVLAASDDLIEQNVADDHLREVYCDQKEKA
jgi:hypothetical protein